MCNNKEGISIVIGMLNEIDIVTHMKNGQCPFHI